jgi:hypothetical protein
MPGRKAPLLKFECAGIVLFNPVIDGVEKARFFGASWNSILAALETVYDLVEASRSTLH